MGVGRSPGADLAKAPLLGRGPVARDPRGGRAVGFPAQPAHRPRPALATLADHPLEAPSVIVVGQVGGPALNWFEGRPLFGRTVVVTRARAQASAFAHELRSPGGVGDRGPHHRGGRPVRRRCPPALRAAVDELSSGTGAYDWLVVTSVNGVERTSTTCPTPGCWPASGWRRWARPRPRPWQPGGKVASLVPQRFVARGPDRGVPRPAAGRGPGAVRPGPRWPAPNCPTPLAPWAGRCATSPPPHSPRPWPTTWPSGKRRRARVTLPHAVVHRHQPGWRR